MGIYDRDYYRQEGERPGMRLAMPFSMVNRLIVLNVAIFLVDALVTKGELSNKLAFYVGSLSKPWLWWQTVTYGFVHSSTDIWHIGGNMLVLWFFGRDIEKLYGRGEFLRLYLALLVFSSLAWAVVGKFALQYSDLVHCVGASGAVSGVLILFAIRYPKRQVLLFFALPMPAWVAGIIWVAFDFFGAIRPTDNVAHSAHLAGMAFAFLYHYLGWNFGRFVPGAFSLSWLKPRPRLKVHDEDPQGQEDQYRELDEQANELLDKVHREGEASLTRKERRILEAYSRRMRQKHR